MKKLISASLAFLLISVFGQACFAQTTEEKGEYVYVQYYPSPEGIYKEVKVNRLEGKDLEESGAYVYDPAACDSGAYPAAQCYARNNPNSGVAPNLRVKGMNADYVDGKSAEDFLIGASIYEAACYCMPLFEVEGLTIGGVSNVLVGASACLLKNSYMQDMLWLGTPVDLDFYGIYFRGLLHCCMAVIDGQCSVATATGLEKYLTCMYCNVVNQVDPSAVIPKINEDYAYCFNTNWSVVQGACSDCNYTGTDFSECAGIMMNPIDIGLDGVEE